MIKFTVWFYVKTNMNLIIIEFIKARASLKILNYSLWLYIFLLLKTGLYYLEAWLIEGTVVMLFKVDEIGWLFWKDTVWATAGLFNN